MATTANARMSLGAILGAVQTTATTITSSLDAANRGIGMLNRTVSDAAKRQDLRSNIDFGIYKETLKGEKAKELAQTRIELQVWMAQSTEHAAAFETAFKEVEEWAK